MGIIGADRMFNDLTTSMGEDPAFDSFDWIKPSAMPDMTITTQNYTIPIGEIPSLPDNSIPAPRSTSPWSTDFHSLENPPDPHLEVARFATIPNILEIINMFLDRLHASMPFFKRSYLIDNIHSHRPLHDQSFNALIHAISALTVFQMVQRDPEQPVSSDEMDKAEFLLAEAVRLHSHSDFGENPVLEQVLTSVFLFGCQFSKGNHHAAKLRLREAITLAETMGLDDPRTYENISRDEKDRRLRTFLCLTVIHRYVLTHKYATAASAVLTNGVYSVYAIQRDSPVNDYLLTSGRLHMVRSTLKQSNLTSSQQEEKAVAGLSRMVDLIDFVDSTFVKCWRNHCWKDSRPQHISARAIATLLQRHTTPMPMQESPNDAQRADILITRHWMCHILWDLGSRHGFLDNKNQLAQMRPDYALTIARDAVDTCESFDMASLECHGIGMVEKLYDIVTSAIRAAQPTEAVTARHLSSPVSSQEVVGLWPLGTVNEPSLDHEDGNLWSEGIVGLKSSPCFTDTVNRFLVIFASFRGGKHPFLKPYMRMLCDLDLD